ncbi:hypothetical protein GCM10022381_25320 [Leifsonia kafniensis]|uniref:HTH tetR-type domain-containing protein n=1 Tax=Leifsonia kafniensis TaxID=475957 RepID=A0ABP7KLP4_9MICO
MPKIVNREERRQEILHKHIELVTRVGLMKATTRELAKEAGMSAGALWNYFDTIDEVVLESFRLSFAPLNERIQSASMQLRGLSAVVAILDELLPASEQSKIEGATAISYLFNSERYPEMNGIQLEMERKWFGLLRDHIREAIDDQEVVADASPVDLSELLLVLVFGLQMEWLLPGASTAQPRRQRELVTLALGPWLCDGVEISRRV